MPLAPWAARGPHTLTTQAASAAGAQRAHIDLFAATAMVFLTFTWGLNATAAKLSTESFSPIFLTTVRSAIGLLCVLVWCAVRGIPLFQRDGTLKAGLMTGALFGFEFILVFIAFEYTTAARGTLMMYTMPFWVLIAAHFVLGERITPAKSAGIVLAFAGVALVLSDDLSAPSEATLLGDILFLVAAFVWAATTILIKGSKLREASGEKTLAYQLATSAVMTAPLLLVTGNHVRDVTALTVGSVLFQGIFVVGFTYLLWFQMMRRYPASGLTSFTFLTPVFGVLCGALLLGEPISWRILAALALIVLGLALVNRRRRAVPVRSG